MPCYAVAQGISLTNLESLSRLLTDDQAISAFRMMLSNVADLTGETVWNSEARGGKWLAEWFGVYKGNRFKIGLSRRDGVGLVVGLEGSRAAEELEKLMTAGIAAIVSRRTAEVAAQTMKSLGAEVNKIERKASGASVVYLKI